MFFSIETISAMTEKGCISIASGAISFRGNFFAAQNPWNFEDDRWTQVVTFKVVEIASTKFSGRRVVNGDTWLKVTSLNVNQWNFPRKGILKAPRIRKFIRPVLE